jgi:hypothetical protein
VKHQTVAWLNLTRQIPGYHFSSLFDHLGAAIVRPFLSNRNHNLWLNYLI